MPTEPWFQPPQFYVYPSIHIDDISQRRFHAIQREQVRVQHDMQIEEDYAIMNTLSISAGSGEVDEDEFKEYHSLSLIPQTKFDQWDYL